MVLQTIPSRLTGIYALLHIPTGRIYVGFSRDIKQRIFGHLERFRWNYHSNKKLERAWELDGPDGFHIVILQPISNELLLPGLEDFWIDKLGSLHPYGFNRRKNVNTRLPPNLARRYTTDEPKWQRYWEETNSRMTVVRARWSARSQARSGETVK